MTWRGLWVCSAIFGLFAAAYQVAGIEPSRPADLLFSYGPSAAVAVWGTFVFFAWPVAVPAYCFWSRGRAGWRTTAGLIAAVFAPPIIGSALWTVYRMIGA